MTVERWLTPTDLKLLGQLARTPNLVRAAKAIGITRDRAVYRLRRLGRMYGRPAATSRRGRGALGSTALTALGRRLLPSSLAHRPGLNHWEGVFQSHPSPHVDLGSGRRLWVAFRAHPHERVAVDVDPESFVVARRRFESSARNVLKAQVEALRPSGAGRVRVDATWEGLRVRAVVTSLSVHRLGIARGTPAFFYLKAVGVRRAPSR